MAAFANGRQLHRHFSEHGNDFGAADAFVYEAMADRFLTGTPGPTVQQCARVQGDVVRFDTATGALGVIDGTNIIRTFMVPIPCSAIMDPVKRAEEYDRGRCHRYGSNLLYFQWNCTRRY